NDRLGHLYRRPHDHPHPSADDKMAGQQARAFGGRDTLMKPTALPGSRGAAPRSAAITQGAETDQEAAERNPIATRSSPGKTPIKTRRLADVAGSGWPVRRRSTSALWASHKRAGRARRSRTCPAPG